MSNYELSFQVYIKCLKFKQSSRIWLKASLHLKEAVPLCLGTIKIGYYPSNQLIYSLIIIRLATFFDPVGSSSGLIRKLRTFFGSQTMFTKDKYERFVSKDTNLSYLSFVNIVWDILSKDTNLSYLSFVNIVWDPKNVRSFLIRPDDDPTGSKHVASLIIINE